MSRYKPLSYEEMVALADEMSDLDYLSDDNGQDQNDIVNGKICKISLRSIL